MLGAGLSTEVLRLSPEVGFVPAGFGIQVDSGRWRYRYEVGFMQANSSPSAAVMARSSGPTLLACSKVKCLSFFD